MCCQAIVEGKDEALFCEGECKRWMHRYCAGIPVSYFQSYGASESPFYCYTCCYRNHASEIASLKETVNSLVTEVTSLRQRITEDHRDGLPATEDVSPLSEAASSSSWRQIAGADAGRSRVGQHRGGRRVGGGRGGKGGRGKGGAGGGAGGLGEDLSSSVGVQHHSRIHEPLPAKYPLKGARKVWGMLKTTTTVAVTNALKLVPDISPGSITVKRKYKTLNGTGRVVTKWWFILRGEEEVLQALENKWNIIAVQTAWRIEPVFYGSTTSNTTGNAVTFAPSDNLANDNCLDSENSRSSPDHTTGTTCGTQSIDETNHPLTLTPSQHERETS